MHTEEGMGECFDVIVCSLYSRTSISWMEGSGWEDCALTWANVHLLIIRKGLELFILTRDNLVQLRECQHNQHDIALH